MPGVFKPYTTLAVGILIGVFVVPRVMSIVSSRMG